MTILSETLGKWIVVNLELGDPLILISGDAKELGLPEGCSGVKVVGHDVLKCEQVGGWHNMNPHMVFVHGGQHNLKKMQKLVLSPSKQKMSLLT